MEKHLLFSTGSCSHIHLADNKQAPISAPVLTHCIQMLFSLLQWKPFCCYSVNNPVIFCCFLCRHIQSLDMIDDEVRLRLRAYKENVFHWKCVLWCMCLDVCVEYYQCVHISFSQNSLLFFFFFCMSHRINVFLILISTLYIFYGRVILHYVL